MRTKPDRKSLLRNLEAGNGMQKQENGSLSLKDQKISSAEESGRSTARHMHLTKTAIW